MTAKAFFSTALTAALLLTTWLPGFAAAADSGTEPDGETPQSETVDNIVQALPELEEPTPAEHENFYIKLTAFSGNGATIKGYFPGFTSDMRDIQSYYSFDDLRYDPVEIDTFWSCPNSLPEGSILSNTIASQDQSPLRDYLANEQDTFYIRLQYETDAGAAISQTARFSRPTQAVPMPEDLTLCVLYPHSMRAGYKARYHLTVRESATAADCRALLPDTLPVELQLMDPDTENWKKDDRRYGDETQNLLPCPDDAAAIDAARRLRQHRNSGGGSANEDGHCHARRNGG